MNIVTEFFKTIVCIVFNVVPTLLGAVFGIKESIESTNDTITAAFLGVPVWVAVAIGTAVTIFSAIVGIIIWWNKKH